MKPSTPLAEPINKPILREGIYSFVVFFAGKDCQRSDPSQVMKMRVNTALRFKCPVKDGMSTELYASYDSEGVFYNVGKGETIEFHGIKHRSDPIKL